MSDNPGFVAGSSALGLRPVWAIVAAAILSLACIGALSAAPPEGADPTLAPWFQSLRQPGTGVSCCSIADCRATEYRSRGEGYEAFIDERWISVPQERVLDHIDNPTGRAVVCYEPTRGILCFVRPSET
ncbi:MAG TPA: hypothetical protein VN832_14675 [Stellaceae bacterium]|nr:hypothetical protein [Stellaceae bacterium]